MARSLSRALIPHGAFLIRRSPAPAPALAPSSLVCFCRRFSSKPQFIEIDLDSPSSSSQSEARAEFIKKLNEMVRRIIVHKSTPEWLPFLPGSSFWVPPSQNAASEIANLVDKVTNQSSEEESLSVMSHGGWPKESFFITPDGSVPPVEVEGNTEFDTVGNEVVEVKIEIFPNLNDESKHGDEEK